MNKIISINLGGRAYQLEEDGYACLNDYLKKAAERLEKDPDKTEIIADLEQAVADKLNRLLSGNKNVVTKEEIEAVIKEMGPVEGPAKEAGEEKTEKEKEGLKTVKRLYRISDGKMIGGICTGLAAYFNIDVVIIRIIFIALAFVTQGIWILAYLVMMLIIPKAKTSEQFAAAYGEPLTAQELVRRVREEVAELTDKSEWKKRKWEMKEKFCQGRREWQKRWQEAWPRGCHCQAGEQGSFGLFIAVFVIFWLISLFMIIIKGAIFSFVLPAAWPLWAVIIGWVFILFLVVSALSSYRCGGGFLGSLASLAWLALICWLIWHFIPDSHGFFLKVKDIAGDAWQAIRSNIQS